MFDKDNKQEVLDVVRMNGMKLKDVSERLKDDKEVVIEALGNCGYASQYASRRLLDDRDVIETAIYCGNPGALIMASERLRDDEDLVLLCVKRSPHLLEYASDSIKDNIYVVMIASRSYKKKYVWDGDIVRYASPRIQKMVEDMATNKNEPISDILARIMNSRAKSARSFEPTS